MAPRSTLLHGAGPARTATARRQTATTGGAADTIAVADAVVVEVTAAVAVAVAAGVANGQGPPPPPCSCVRPCPGSRPVLQLLRHVIPPCLQTPRPLGSPEKAWPCPATDGSVTCRLPCSPVSTIKRTRGRRQMNMYRYRSLASRVHRRCSGHSRGQGRRGQPAETEPRCPTDGCRRYTCRYCCCRDRESPPELHVRHTIDHAVDSPADYTADHPLTMMTLISLPFTRPPSPPAADPSAPEQAWSCTATHGRVERPVPMNRVRWQGHRAHRSGGMSPAGPRRRQSCSRMRRASPRRTRASPGSRAFCGRGWPRQATSGQGAPCP